MLNIYYSIFEQQFSKVIPQTTSAPAGFLAMVTELKYILGNEDDSHHSDPAGICNLPQMGVEYHSVSWGEDLRKR